MAQWHSLYLPSDDSQTILSACQTALVKNGLDSYDPFGLMPVTRAYTETVKAFIAPAQNGWTRVVLSSDTPPHAALVASLSQITPLLTVSVLDDGAEITAWHNGAQINATDMMANYADRAALEAALNAKYDTKKAKDDSLLDVIPEELRGLMGEGSLKKAEGMLGRMAGRALSMNERAAAATMLREMVVDWASEGGQRIRAVMALMPIPHWAVPDYVLLRDAYRQQMRVQRNANAQLNDEAKKLVQAVPNALAYAPLFYGK